MKKVVNLLAAIGFLLSFALISCSNAGPTDGDYTVVPPECLGEWKGHNQFLAWGFMDVELTVGFTSWEVLYYKVNESELQDYSGRGIYANKYSPLPENTKNLVYVTEQYRDGEWISSSSPMDNPMEIYYAMSEDKASMTLDISDPRPDRDYHDVYTVTKRN